MNSRVFVYLSFFSLLALFSCAPDSPNRLISNFNSDWKFILDDSLQYSASDVNDALWRTLNLPHDWSIEGDFDENNPATVGGGALPGGIGWYRKHFFIDKADHGKSIYIEFDGIYMNSEIWINGTYLGKRSNGYVSFSYDLTSAIKFGQENVIAVKVDNKLQPNSRWYSGCGIYRNVRLVTVQPVHIVQWGTYITTPKVTSHSATIAVATTILNKLDESRDVKLRTVIVSPDNVMVAQVTNEPCLSATNKTVIKQEMEIVNPKVWSLESPSLYSMVTEIIADEKVIDRFTTPFGIRDINFDPYKGFSLNGEPVKLRGVCNHHDLGALGAAINVRAMERQLEILKEMGCNAIRTSHNPPAPELLDLCDRMGFLVMDETFDMWKLQKVEYDFHLFWDEWHTTDLQAHITRDRNHPSVCIWSVGNEIPEQWAKDGDTSGVAITRELVNTVKALDTTRPITTANNETSKSNQIIRSGALDVIGYNYHHEDWESFHKRYPKQKLIVTESTSALQTRGYYQMPSDTTYLWPIRWDIPFSTPHVMCSSYDNVHAPWGSSHEQAVMLLKNNDHVSGMFVWTGFDYIGEPTPYGWPARSSHFGIIDLAGFPKDVYYMYQSEWTNKPVLHLFPHWNWEVGQTVDVWAYSNADEVELFLNGKSMGVRQKPEDKLHFMWRLIYEPGTLKAIAKKDGKVMKEQEIHTASEPAAIRLQVDRSRIDADGVDLSFVSVFIEDKNGVLVPYANNKVNFEILGSGFIAGVDNGSPISHERFKASERQAFFGKCLAIIQNDGTPGFIKLTATSEGLISAEVTIEVK